MPIKTDAVTAGASPPLQQVCDINATLPSGGAGVVAQGRDRAGLWAPCRSQFDQTTLAL